MKKYFAVLLLSGFLIPVLPISAQEVKKNIKNTETISKQNSAKKKKKCATTMKGKTEAQSSEQRKKDIEAKERLVDKNKKVKRVGVDENLPKTIRERNIP